MNVYQFLFNFCYVIKQTDSFLFLLKEKKIADLLVKHKLKLACAESCTGGLLSSRMTDVAGSSSYIMQNFVTYANEAKEQLLGVNHAVILEHGVVSREVASEMTTGLLNKYDCDIAVSTTGIAGPGGATATKPVGLVYMAIANKNTQRTYKFEANPMFYRRVMKYVFTNQALDYLFEFLNENY